MYVTHLLWVGFTCCDVIQYQGNHSQNSNVTAFASTVHEEPQIHDIPPSSTLCFNTCNLRKLQCLLACQRETLSLGLPSRVKLPAPDSVCHEVTASGIVGDFSKGNHFGLCGADVKWLNFSGAHTSFCAEFKLKIFKVFLFNPTLSCCCNYSLECQMCVNPQQEIVPNK